MKKKYRNLLLAVGIILPITAIVFGSLKWDEKLQLTGVEATQLLENEGITIRTVDTTKFAERQPNSEQVPQTTEAKESEASAKDLTNEAPREQSLTSSTEKSQGTSNPKGEVAQTKPRTEITLTEIKQQYMVKFLTLEGEISASLNDLLDQAIADYREKKANNKQMNVRDFQTKLATDIRQLEASSDQQFNAIYQQLEIDLVENGFSKAEATPFRAQYQAEKKIREQRAIQKLLELNEG